MNIENYFLKGNDIYRKTYFCENLLKMFYEKKLKKQKIKKYEYVYISGKLCNFDKLKSLF